MTPADGVTALDLLELKAFKELADVGIVFVKKYEAILNALQELCQALMIVFPERQGIISLLPADGGSKKLGKNEELTFSPF